MARATFAERVPAAPFVEWLDEQVRRIERDDTLRLAEQADTVPSRRILANRLGVSERWVYRLSHSLDSVTNEPTDNFAREVVEDALHRADVRFEDVYPEIAAAEDAPLEPDAYCGSCREIVTPINGACPWCDRPASTDVPKRMYCKREDTASFAALDGNCWRCGGELRQHMPRRKCACGCGRMVVRFDVRGREVTYLLGHAPRSIERQLTVDAERFAVWLEDELRNLDPIQSLARRVGLKRDELLGLLNRRDTTITVERVRKSLWVASREGQGKGILPRPGSTRLADLYPEAVHPRVCPECSKPKSWRAQRCRACAEAAGVYPGNRTPSSLTSDQIDGARVLREQGGLTFLAIAERLQSRTRMTNVESVKNQLILEFHRRGWSTARLDRVAA